MDGHFHCHFERLHLRTEPVRLNPVISGHSADLRTEKTGLQKRDCAKNQS